METNGSVALKLLREVCRASTRFPCSVIWRKQKDSNLRQVEPVPVLKTGAIDRSAMLPIKLVAKIKGMEDCLFHP